MKLDRKSAINHIIGKIRQAKIEEDFRQLDDGQLIFVSDLFIWKDQSIHDEAENVVEEESFEEITVAPKDSPKE